jgi:hypothetical protein
MRYTFNDTERKEAISKLLSLPKYQEYTETAKIDLLRLHFLYFKPFNDNQIREYLCNLVQ